jgi:hypothetical protein
MLRTGPAERLFANVGMDSFAPSRDGQRFIICVPITVVRNEHAIDDAAEPARIWR